MPEGFIRLFLHVSIFYGLKLKQARHKFVIIGSWFVLPHGLGLDWIKK